MSKDNSSPETKPIHFHLVRPNNSGPQEYNLRTDVFSTFFPQSSRIPLAELLTYLRPKRSDLKVNPGAKFKPDQRINPNGIEGYISPLLEKDQRYSPTIFVGSMRIPDYPEFSFYYVDLPTTENPVVLWRAFKRGTDRIINEISVSYKIPKNRNLFETSIKI